MLSIFLLFWVGICPAEGGLGSIAIGAGELWFHKERTEVGVVQREGARSIRLRRAGAHFGDMRQFAFYAFYDRKDARTLHTGSFRTKEWPP